MKPYGESSECERYRLDDDNHRRLVLFVDTHRYPNLFDESIFDEVTL